MRNDDLKNRLDQRPVSFDRESLWERIDAETDKKKRRFAWWWFAGLAVLLLGAYGGVNWLSNGEENPLAEQTGVKESITSKTIEKEESQIQNDLSTNHSEKVKEQSEILDTQTDQIDQADKELIEQSKIKEESTNSKSGDVKSNDPHSSYSSTTILKDKPAFKEENINEYTQNTLVETVSNTIGIDVSEKDNVVAIANEVDKNGMLNPELNALTNSLLLISPIQSLSMALDWNNEVPVMDKEIIPILPETKSKTPRNSFLFAAGIGTDNHQFRSNDLYDRMSLEKNLESIGASVFYKRKLTDQFVLFGGLSYARSQTENSQSYTTDDTYSRSLQDGNTYLITTQTKHILYNEYSRLDAMVGVGYHWSPGNWSVAPNLSFGKTLMFSNKGDVITDEYDIIALDDLNIYKDDLGTFFRYGINVDYRIRQTIKIGLGVSRQSTQNLQDILNGHTINPTMLNLYIAKEW